MAHTFVDRFDRTWNVALDFAGAKRIDNSDFSNITTLKDFTFLRPTKDTFNEIVSNPPFLVALVWALVQPQVKEKTHIDPETDYEKAETEFLRGIDGPAYERLRDTFCEALASFFPAHRTALLSSIRQRTIAQAQLEKELAEIGTKAEVLIEQEISQAMKPLKEAIASGDPAKVKALLDQR